MGILHLSSARALFYCAALVLFFNPCVFASSNVQPNATQSFFIKRGDKFFVTSRDALDLHERLPSAAFTVDIDPVSGSFFLQQIGGFEVKGKIYGDSQRQADRILGTFWDREGSTGVLLAGEKGSGKTFLAKLLSIQAAERYDCPTVVINQPLHGERFNSFIQSIRQPTLLLFDEFEKVYRDDSNNKRSDHEEILHYHRHRHGENEREVSIPAQDSMLTLLDGTYPSKMLFVFTSNDKYKVSNNMRNRPGRIYYVIDFEGLSLEFIREYCQDNLLDKKQIGTVIAVSAIFEAFNFDMLQALVEEMNRYGESADQALEFLNVKPEFGVSGRFEVQMTVKGKALSQNSYESSWYGNPLNSVITIRFMENFNAVKSMLGLDSSQDLSKLDFSASEHLVGIDGATGTFSYFNEELKARLVLTKVRRSRSARPISYDKLTELTSEESAEHGNGEL